MKINSHYSAINARYRYMQNSPLHSYYYELRNYGLDARIVNGSMLSFDITDDSIHFSMVLRIVEQLKQIEGTAVNVIYTKKYTEDELIHAEYISVESIYMGIRPLDQYRSSYFSLEHESDEYKSVGATGERKKEHFVQVGPPTIKRKPAWQGARQFASDYFSGGQYLYCSSEVKRLIEETHLLGVVFGPVIDVKGQCPCDDVFQLKPFLCDDFLIDGKYMLPPHYCKICGKRRHIMADGRGELLLNKSLLPPRIDFLQTPPVVGADIGRPLCVISNRAYRILKKAQVTRGLVFQPLRMKNTGDGSQWH